MEYFVVGLFFVVIYCVAWSKGFRVGANEARKQSENLWQVDRVVVQKRERTLLQFSKLCDPSEALRLRVWPGHPDIPKFRQLLIGDVVRFSPLNYGMNMGLERDLSDHLRIESINEEMMV